MRETYRLHERLQETAMEFSDDAFSVGTEVEPVTRPSHRSASSLNKDKYTLEDYVQFGEA